MDEASGATVWQIRKGGRPSPGTFTSDQIAALYTRGELSGTDELWCQEIKGWAKAWQLESRFMRRPAGAPPPLPNAEPVRISLDLAPDTTTVQRLDAPVSGIDGEIICPFCWNRYNLEDLKFVAEHEDLTDDSAQIGDDVRRRFVPIRFTPDGDAIDAGDTVCKKRACPVCHFHIPMPYFEMPPLFLSLIGSTHSGKSVLLPSLVRTLRSRCRELFNIKFGTSRESVGDS